MQRRELDPETIQMIKGSSAFHSLADMKITLALIQAAIVLALEGNARATAGQVTERAIREYGIAATPSFTGQVFASRHKYDYHARQESVRA